MLYIKEGIQYNGITNLAGSEVESVWANIQCAKQQLALGIMYRPPSSNHAYLKSILDQIDNVYSYNENVMLMGDLNYDYKLDESLSSNPLHQIEILYGMRQLTNFPTRVTLTTSTIIDVMCSTEHESHVVTGVYDISLSDHYMTYTIYSKISRKTCLHKEINFRNYKRFNIDSFMLLSHCGEYPCECKKIYSRQIRQKVANIRRMGLRMQFATNRNDRKMIARHS